MSITSLIKRERESRNLSMDELCALSKVSKSTISKMERGVIDTKFSTVVKVLDALDMAIEVKSKQEINGSEYMTHYEALHDIQYLVSSLMENSNGTNNILRRNKMVVESIENLNKNFFIELSKNIIYNSNKIENSKTRLRDVEKLYEGKNIIHEDLTLRELQNHKSVYDVIMDIRGEKLSIELILAYHARLMRGCYSEGMYLKGERAGKFKLGDYVVGELEIGLPPDEVEDNLKSLVDEVNEVKVTGSNALKILAYFHCWFESIHPFADGNGRVGRVLMNHILIQNSLHPIVIFNSDRDEYYKAFRYFNDTQEISYMVRFLELQYKRTMELMKNKKKPVRLSSFLDN